ncbi:MAG: bifunctional phosphoribosyl-AMP cyclohydrolase/phosphoribosyl-ATP diphosphatase HisIE [Bacteroidetes bacterium]|nr:bifunctional phosphoribosyl-AMP cyclohydrolase/phosphoribosyl-ATP diphosphatase HisIE [Bacteroidota bacterium]
MIENINFEKLGGIIPVVVQDSETLQVAMVGFMNKEALEKTLADKKVTFWSRTRNCLWQKGETSGHYLEPLSFHLDCDNDSLLIKAKTHGPVCHTGNHTCFGDKEQIFLQGAILEKLEGTIEQRKTASPEESYTAKLYSKGIGRIAQKVGEEAVETVIAALQSSEQLVAEEAADLLYHLLVLLHQRGMTFSDVTKELQRRMK